MIYCSLCREEFGQPARQKRGRIPSEVFNRASNEAGSSKKPRPEGLQRRKPHFGVTPRLVTFVGSQPSLAPGTEDLRRLQQRSTIDHKQALNGEGMAIAGIVLGYISIFKVVCVILLVLLIVVVASALGFGNDVCLMMR